MWWRNEQLLNGKELGLLQSWILNLDLNLLSLPRVFGPLLHSQLVDSARTNMSAIQRPPILIKNQQDS